MEIIFMPKHQTWQMLQWANILSLRMYFHTGNVYCGDVLTFLVSIFLTKKQLKNMTKLHPLVGFTFITSLDVVLLMVEFHWNTRKYVTCVNKNLYQINLQKIYTRKEIVMTETTISDFHTSFYIPAIQKLAFHLPSVRILGTNHCVELRLTAFKRRELFQYVLCLRDYAERVVASFSHKTQ